MTLTWSIVAAGMFAATVASAQTAPVVGHCEPAVGTGMLDHNNVTSRVYTNGVVRAGTNAAVGYQSHVGYENASLWISGKVDGEDRVAYSHSATYGLNEFWPGPLLSGARLPQPYRCTNWDRVHEITTGDLQAYESTGVISENLRDWPWEQGAPVVDGDGVADNYDLAGGDRPELIGSQRLWWVMNDVGNRHGTTGSRPLGIEVQASAIAASSDRPAIDNASYQVLKIINRSDSIIDSLFVGLENESVTYAYSKHAIGTDTTLSLAYGYALDPGYPTSGPVPDRSAYGTVLVAGAPAHSDGLDNDADGSVDEPGEHAGLAHVMAFMTSDGSLFGAPSRLWEYPLYLHGRWRDRRPLTEGGLGRDFSTRPVRFSFPGDPVTGSFWSGQNLDGAGTLMEPLAAPSGWTYLVSLGPVRLKPSESVTYVVAYVWARGEDALGSVTALKGSAAEVREAWYGTLPESVPSVPTEVPELISPAPGAADLPNPVRLVWEQRPGHHSTRVQVAASRDFSTLMHDEVHFGEAVELNLGPDTPFYWRAAAEGRFGHGAWSETRDARTGAVVFGNPAEIAFDFEVTANAAGSLVPPDCGAFGFPGAEFPMSCGADAGTRGRQQSTNESVWGIHATGASSAFGPATVSDSFLGRVLGTNVDGVRTLVEGARWEIRFTASGGKALDRGNVTTTVDVPFEVWRTGGEVPDDPSNDLRLIPEIDERTRGESVATRFTINPDHHVSPDEDDPYSDAFHLWLPVDMTPGDAGYQTFVAGGGRLGVGSLVLSRLTLVNLDGGSRPPYVSDLPEPGTVFRITASATRPPVLTAPAPEALIRADRTVFAWQTQFDESARFQLAEDGNFITMVLDEPNVSSGLTVVPPGAGVYFWRVVGADGLVSDERQVQFILQGVSTEGDDLPSRFSLDPVYPNPFHSDTLIRYALPVALPVRLEVFDALGRRVVTLTDQSHVEAGFHAVRLDGSHLASGVYFVTLRAGGVVRTRSVIVAR